MIQDVTELRERGQVYRRVDELDVDVDSWRAEMRRAARREGMRIRTFVVVRTNHKHVDDAEPADDWPVPRSDLVCAMRTDLPPSAAAEPAEFGDMLSAPPGYQPSKPPPSAASLSDEQVFRSVH